MQLTIFINVYKPYKILQLENTPVGVKEARAFTLQDTTTKEELEEWVKSTLVPLNMYKGKLIGFRNSIKDELTVKKF